MLDAAFISATPEAIGLRTDRLDRLHEYVEQQVASGLPSAQIAVGRRGKVAGVRTFGTVTAGGISGPATNDTLYCLFSSTKGIVGGSMWALIEDGKLRLDERVSDIVSEFAGLGKDDITVEQVLTFTGGFPLAPMHPRLWEDRDARLERMKGWRLNWEPGTRYEYHATSAHWVLVEIIHRRTGLDFRDFVRLRMTVPMGVPDLYVGLPDALHARAADIVIPEEASGDASAEGNAATRLHFNLPSQRRAGAPGAGGFAGAGELALFYQRLVSVADSEGYAPLRQATIDMAMTVHTQVHHVDASTGLPANRGLSVVVAGEHPLERGFGAHASPRAFGHSGAGGQIAWGDPVTGLSVGFVTNGFVPSEQIRERSRTVSTLAAECLV